MGEGGEWQVGGDIITGIGRLAQDGAGGRV